jgi:hypothetical protein
MWQQSIARLLKRAQHVTERLQDCRPIGDDELHGAIQDIVLLAKYEYLLKRQRLRLENALLARPEHRAILFERHSTDQQTHA